MQSNSNRLNIYAPNLYATYLAENGNSVLMTVGYGKFDYEKASPIEKYSALLFGAALRVPF